MTNASSLKFIIPVTIVTVTLVTLTLSLDPVKYPVLSSLIINLLASLITVIATTTLIDRRIRQAREKDAAPGLEMAKRILTTEVNYVIAGIGYVVHKTEDRKYETRKLDPKKNFHVAIAERDEELYLDGLQLAKSYKRKTIIGLEKTHLQGLVFTVDRLEQSIDEILSNFSDSLSLSNRNNLYAYKRQIARNKINISHDREGVVGYDSPDENYVSNTDQPEDKLTSYDEYHFNKLRELILQLHNMRLRLPV